MAGSSTQIATDGVGLPINSLASSMTYEGAFLSTVTVTYNGIEYVQTYTNDGTFITAVSQWTPSGP